MKLLRQNIANYLESKNWAHFLHQDIKPYFFLKKKKNTQFSYAKDIKLKTNKWIFKKIKFKI